MQAVKELALSITHQERMEEALKLLQELMDTLQDVNVCVEMNQEMIVGFDAIVEYYCREGQEEMARYTIKSELPRMK